MTKILNNSVFDSWYLCFDDEQCSCVDYNVINLLYYIINYAQIHDPSRHTDGVDYDENQ